MMFMLQDLIASQYYRGKTIRKIMMETTSLSYFWKGLLASLNTFLTSYKVVVGSGTTTSFSHDIWCLEENLKDKFHEFKI